MLRQLSKKYRAKQGGGGRKRAVKASPAATSPPADVVARLPAGLDGYVGGLLTQYPVEVRLVPRRASKLGDHRPPTAAFPWHRITVNEDLNPYALGVTLLHEVAHLVTHLKHQSRRRLQPHGPEWQRHYTAILQPVLAASFLPEDLAEALMAAGERPRAATCSDRRLLLALARYDATADDRCRIEELSPGTIFETETGRRFILGTRLRSRYRCLEACSGTEYRVHGLARVARVARVEPD